MKTSNYLKTSLGFLVTAIIILAVAEALTKRKLKECESRQSYGCPRFTCPETDSQCGNRPWICPPDQKTCVGQHHCIGYCTKGEKNCSD